MNRIGLAWAQILYWSQFFFTKYFFLEKAYPDSDHQVIQNRLKTSMFSIYNYFFQIICFDFECLDASSTGLLMYFYFKMPLLEFFLLFYDF